jgi:ribose 5-phosphate isomerase B
MAEELQNIAMGSDHAGYCLKEFLKVKLQEEGFAVTDFGTLSEQSVDYPDMIHPLAKAVNEGTYKKAVIICGSGNGVSMVANKYPHVRAALCWQPEIAALARQHNDANIMALPARFIPENTAWECVRIFLSTDFEGGRHQRRVDKIPFGKEDAKG